MGGFAQTGTLKISSRLPVASDQEKEKNSANKTGAALGSAPGVQEVGLL